MVQLSAVPDEPAAVPGPVGTRERNRLARHRGYLRAALHVISEEGLEALTMQRLAAEVGASVGSVYTYFPSKGALVAEVQREAVERLASSALVLGGDVDRAVGRRPDDADLLAPVVAFGRFWLTADATYPEEMRLLLLLLSDAQEAVPAEEAGRVVPAALRLLGLAEARLRTAAERGALGGDRADGDLASRRTIALAAALTGCLQLRVVQRWDDELLDPVASGRHVLDALLLGWGAAADALAAAHRLVDRLEADGPLARPLPEGTEP
ncbi:MAG: helix-turn-helix domain-containing protein [Acidimicrobiia bacterium]